MTVTNTKDKPKTINTIKGVKIVGQDIKRHLILVVEEKDKCVWCKLEKGPNV